uniref:F-actin-capping protein subunit alpha n=1 Tax=Strombidium inclinatum TaxID=197538 RepID=A0A7S3MT64_9SPIT|mmetsp:Transcript_12961/g.20076  ORF Transcript_12961/g.20076 Transcript_12961/m.20076 type:complete len:169 (+) Transcript_12961:346-852(+)
MVLSEDPMSVETCPLRDGLVSELNQYLDECFKKGKALHSVVQGAEEGEQTIDISCHNWKLESFWAGEWLSSWTLSQGRLSGSIKIRCHYFEQGNIQFNLDKEFADVQVKDASSAHDIMAAIKKTESTYQLNLDDMYQNIQEQLMKRMRRAVPVTGRKFDWEKPAGITR